MRILVTGSRDWQDKDAIRRALLAIAQNVGQGDLITVVHGDAAGADRIAGDVAIEQGWEIDVYPADWDRYGKRAGPIRNSAMLVKRPDICVAFPIPGSRGTWDMVHKAEAALVPTLVHCDDGKMRYASA